MKRDELVAFLDSFLAISDYPDPSLNGLQVEGADEVTTVAVAVDSSLSTFEQAAALGAQMLIVHHGLFWGEPKAITGAHGKRVRFLLERGISLYAAHIPLDADRKSTRLNSSHVRISYAVFCLKKKKKIKQQ